MASNFKPWVDSPTAGQQVQSAQVFATDAQRVDGFKAGDPASALRVNSALRQANIVAAGLMQMCDDIKTLPDGLSLMSTVTQVKNAIKAAIDQLDATVLASAKSYTDTREVAINGKITNVQNQVTSNKNRLDALEPRVDDLEKGTPGMTVGEAEMLTKPFAVGKDTTSATTGYVKFASVSIPSAYRSASARFEVLDKNPVNAQTNMCGVEVIIRNTGNISVTVTAQLLYGSSEYLSKIYACVKKGEYPVLVDLYFDITSSNPQETISCIKPLFTFTRVTGSTTFTFITDNVVVTDLPVDTTNTQLSTVYTAVTEAKTAEIHSLTQLANNADLNTYYGESYWGRLYYATGNNSIVNRPIESDNNGFSLEILRGGAGGTIQRCTIYAAGGSATQPVVFTRWHLGTAWKEWQETAEATGAYPNLGAGYLAKSITVANGTLTKQYYKLCTYTSPKVSKSSSFIFLINGIYGDQPASFAAESGILEFDIRSDSGGVASSMTGLSILSGNLNPNDFFIVISDDLSSVSLYSYLAQQYGSHKITQIDSSKDDAVTFDGTRYSTAPTGAIYAVRRNIASEADAAKQLSRNAILNVPSTNNVGWWEVGKINVDDVKNLSVASTFSVIMLVNGVHPENEYSGFIELDGTTADSLWNIVNLKMLCGSFDVGATFEFCAAISSDGKYLTLYVKATRQFNRLSFTILDEYYSAVRTTYFSFNPQFYGTDAPPNAAYGKPAPLSNPNLLINPDFSINQRGKKSYSGGAYGVDRWLFATGTTAEIQESGALKLKRTEAGNCCLQRIEDWKKLVGKTVTLSVKFSQIIAGSVKCNLYTGTTFTGTTVSTSGSVSTITVTIPADATKVECFIYADSACEVIPEYAKLEIGSVVTLFTPPIIAEELSKCQRYGLLLASGPVRYPSTRMDASIIDFTIPTPVSLRTPPTLSDTANIVVYTPGMTAQSGFTFEVVHTTSNAICIRATKSRHGLPSAVLGFSANVFLDAEI